MYVHYVPTYDRLAGQITMTLQMFTGYSLWCPQTWLENPWQMEVVMGT